MKTNLFHAMLCLITMCIACSNPSGSTSSGGSAAKDSLQTESTPTPAAGGDLKGLGGLEGKMPTENGVFSTMLPESRLKALLGVEYPDFKKDWSDETPVQKDGEIVYFAGCNKNTCAENAYLVIVDLLSNQVNIMNFKGTIVRTYEEGGVVIGLTDKLVTEVNRMRSRQ